MEDKKQVVRQAGQVLCLTRTPNPFVYESLVETFRSIGELGFTVCLVSPEGEDGSKHVAAGLQIDWQPVPMNTGRGMPASMRMAWRAKRLISGRPTMAVLGVDAISSTMGRLLSAAHRLPFIYYGLELPARRKDSAGLLRRLEHWAYRRADLVITMHGTRADFIHLETGASPDRIALLPNCCRGAGSRHRTRFLRERFGIPDGDIVILHAGGIGAAQDSLPLAQAAPGWGKGRHLVFHAHCPMDREPYYREFAGKITELANVHLNADAVAPDALDDVVGGADIGIAWYNRDILDYRADLLSLSAGKIGRYLRNGLPVIVRNLPTIRPFIDEYRCGVCIDSLSDAASAIDTIVADYEAYVSNAQRCHEELWRPDRYLAALKTRIGDLIEASRR
jgi:hypothetical protein